MRILEGNATLAGLSRVLHTREGARNRKRKQRAWDSLLGRRADGATIRPIK